jgi:hypothetical protein
VSNTVLAVGLATTLVAVSGVSAIGHVMGKAPSRLSAPPQADVDEPRGPAPIVSAAGSKDVRLSDEPQRIGVSGSGFAKGLTVTLVAPLGLATTYASTSLQNLTPTSFALSVPLDEPGTYTLTVRSEAGVRSNPVQVIVKPKK